MSIDTSGCTQELPLLGATNSLNKAVSAPGVQLRYRTVIAVEPLLAGKVVQHDENGMHLSVLCLLLVRNHLLLRVYDAGQFRLVQRFE